MLYAVPPSLAKNPHPPQAGGGRAERAYYFGIHSHRPIHRAA